MSNANIRSCHCVQLNFILVVYHGLGTDVWSVPCTDRVHLNIAEACKLFSETYCAMYTQLFGLRGLCSDTVSRFNHDTTLCVYWACTFVSNQRGILSNIYCVRKLTLTNTHSLSCHTTGVRVWSFSAVLFCQYCCFSKGVAVLSPSQYCQSLPLVNDFLSNTVVFYLIILVGARRQG